MATTQEQIDFIIGPQVPIGDSWLDQTLIAKAKLHGEACPVAPPADDNGLNSFVLLHYYDLPLSERIALARTQDAVFLASFRKCADAWWKHPTWIGEGKIRKWPDEASPPPRHAGIFGLTLRALDGRPEMWDWINSYTRYFFDLYVKRRLTSALYDLREGAFALHFATILAKVLPDSFPLQSGGTVTNGAELRAQYLTDAEMAVVQYFGRTQRADGAWVWNDDWKADDGGSLQGVMQPFMVGLLLTALCDVHALTTNATVKENVKNQILKGCRHLYEGGPYIKDQIEQVSGKKVRGFHYFYHGGTSVNPTRYAKGDIAFPWAAAETWYVPSARQAIAAILPAFGYAFKISGDEFFKTAGNELFESAYGGADGFRSMLADTAKNYNQHARRVGSYLAWAGGIVPKPTPEPEPKPMPSPDGTKAITITDSENAVWTIGAKLETLRNGTQAAGGAGSIYKYVSNVVYVLGTDANWYRWSGSWTLKSPEPKVEPGTIAPTPTPDPPTPSALKYVYDQKSLPSAASAKLKLFNDMGALGWRLVTTISSTAYFEKIG